MSFVNVNGSKLTTLRTIPSENFFNLPVQNICRNFLGNSEEMKVRKAFIVAETLFDRTHAADNYG